MKKTPLFLMLASASFALSACQEKAEEAAPAAEEAAPAAEEAAPAAEEAAPAAE